MEIKEALEFIINSSFFKQNIEELKKNNNLLLIVGALLALEEKGFKKEEGLELIKIAWNNSKNREFKKNKFLQLISTGASIEIDRKSGDPIVKKVKELYEKRENLPHESRVLYYYHLAQKNSKGILKVEMFLKDLISKVEKGEEAIQKLLRERLFKEKELEEKEIIFNSIYDEIFSYALDSLKSLYPEKEYEEIEGKLIMLIQIYKKFVKEYLEKNDRDLEELKGMIGVLPTKEKLERMIAVIGIINYFEELKKLGLRPRFEELEKNLQERYKGVRDFYVHTSILPGEEGINLYKLLEKKKELRG